MTWTGAMTSTMLAGRSFRFLPEAGNIEYRTRGGEIVTVWDQVGSDLFTVRFGDGESRIVAMRDLRSLS